MSLVFPTLSPSELKQPILCTSFSNKKSETLGISTTLYLTPFTILSSPPAPSFFFKESLMASSFLTNRNSCQYTFLIFHDKSKKPLRQLS